VTGGDGARGPGSQLSEPVGFDDGEELGSVRGEERHDEAGALREPDVRLDTAPAELEVGGGHHVQPAVLEPEPEPRLVLHDPARQAGEASLHRVHRVRRAEELLDVGFTKVERHRRDSLGRIERAAVQDVLVEPRVA
jgi:hypothetical protein